MCRTRALDLHRALCEGKRSFARPCQRVQYLELEFAKATKSLYECPAKRRKATVLGRFKARQRAKRKVVYLQSDGDDGLLCPNRACEAR
jgi:hypothetical protein